MVGAAGARFCGMEWGGVKGRGGDLGEGSVPDGLRWLRRRRSEEAEGEEEKQPSTLSLMS